MQEQLLTLTPAAIDRVKAILGDAQALRVGIKTTGCSGFSYKLDLATEVLPDDTVVQAGGVKVVVAPKVADLVAGTEVDFVQDKLGAQFVFKNPNEKARCGCGESFSV